MIIFLRNKRSKIEREQEREKGKDKDRGRERGVHSLHAAASFQGVEKQLFQEDEKNFGRKGVCYHFWAACALEMLLA